jgi:hypothetical protein
MNLPTEYRGYVRVGMECPGFPQSCSEQSVDIVVAKNRSDAVFNLKPNQIVTVIAYAQPILKYSLIVGAASSNRALLLVISSITPQ